MNIYDRLGVRRLINAVDTYTIIGGSLIPHEVMEAMAEASRSFVNIEQLHDRVGQRLAELTRNESAFVTSGAAAGLAVAAAAAVTGTDLAMAQQLPDTEGMQRREVIVHRCQRNGYDHAIRQAGVKLVEIGYVDGTTEWQLESAITERTAAIFYFAASVYSRGALPLEDVIAIGKRHHIPVIVDAAAQLPPVDNLWHYTRQLGAEAAIFSGGKTLRGPQSTGLIVGTERFIEACRVNSAPRHAIGRSMKAGKEEIIGLLAAVERYIALDPSVESARLERMVGIIADRLCMPGVRVERLFPGPVGQTYPRAAVYLKPDAGISAEAVKDKLEHGEPGIMVGLTDDAGGIVINPLNLTETELDIVLERFARIVSAARQVQQEVNPNEGKHQEVE